MRVSIIIPAAGESTRMGGDIRKPFMELAGEPILYHTCKALKKVKGVTEIILAVHAEDLDYAEGKLWEELSSAGVNMVVAGGDTRAESVWNAVAVCDPMSELVAIHDAVRPFISPAICKDLFEKAKTRGAAVPIIPVTDTIKRSEVDTITETLRRRGLVRVQTPQVFNRNLFIDACEHALATGGLTDNYTDDASIVEAYGKKVAVVLGEEYNFKITTPRDLKIAEALVAAGLPPQS